MIRFSCLCLLICAVAIFPRLASAAHPCDVHQEPQKRKACLQQHEENQRRAEAQSRAQAQQKQREQAERQRQAQIQREQQERQKQEQMQAQRRQIEQQQAAERKRQQAQVEAQRRAEEVRQKEAARREEAKRLALIESQERAEAERLAKAARDKEDRERLLAQKKRNESGPDQSAGKSGDKSGGAKPQSVAQAGGRNPVVSAPDPTRTASPQTTVANSTKGASTSAIAAASVSQVPTNSVKKADAEAQIDAEVKRRMALQTIGTPTPTQTAGSTPITVPAGANVITSCGSNFVQRGILQVNELGTALLTGVSFETACQAHDACYGRRDCTMTRNACDDAFNRDMASACNSVPPGIRRQTCIDQAKMYHSAVVKKGRDAYNKVHGTMACRAP